MRLSLVPSSLGDYAPKAVGVAWGLCVQSLTQRYSREEPVQSWGVETFAVSQPAFHCFIKNSN